MQLTPVPSEDKQLNSPLQREEQCDLRTKRANGLAPIKWLIRTLMLLANSNSGCQPGKMRFGRR